jgi:hypothetical protein
MKDRDFLFGATADMVYELDRTAANNGGSRKLTAEEAIKLCEVDSAQAVKRLRDDAARPQLEKQLPVRKGLFCRSKVVDQHGKVYASVRTLTMWGNWRRLQRAYNDERVRQMTGGTAYAAEPTCQHYVPFGVECGQCPPRADS